jgi:glycoside/pentoside/hexuronide:cation symporter, GPH family
MRPTTRWLYGFGAVAFGVKDNGFSYFLMFYYNQVLGLPGSLAGMAIFIAMMIDAACDPLIGFWSDNTRSRLGRRHPFMYAAALPVAIAYFFIWNPPALSEFWLFIYLTVLSVLVRLFVSIYETPSTAIVAELTEDYDERTRLLSLRYMFGWAGGLTMAFLMWHYFMVTYGVTGHVTYESYGLVGSIAMVTAILLSAGGLHRQIPHLHQPPPRQRFRVGEIIGQVGVTLSNRNFLSLFMAGLFAAVGAGVATNFDAYINTHFWEFTPEQVSWIVLTLFFSAALAAGFSTLVTQRFDKKATAIGIYAVSILWSTAPVALRLLDWFPVNHSPLLFPIMVVHTIISVTLIIMFGIVQSSMLADIVEESELKTGRREEGLFFAARTFAAKATSGIGTLFAGIALDLIHFPRGAAPGSVPAEAVFNLGLIYGPMLMVFYVLALASMCFYRITRSKHDHHLEVLKRRPA